MGQHEEERPRPPAQHPESPNRGDREIREDYADLPGEPETKWPPPQEPEPEPTPEPPDPPPEDE